MPPGFPSDIPVALQEYRNWSQTIVVSTLWTCAPRDADGVVAVCNWAKAQSPAWQVRPKGVAHGWSPLTVVQGTQPEAAVILVDTTQSMKKLKFIAARGTAPAMVEAQVGARMENLLLFLQYQDGGRGPASGFAFPHVPAPGSLTIGGVLAINGHGTAVPAASESLPAAYGSVSNHITAFTAVVSSDTAPFDYCLKAFDRGDPDAAALLVHAGRAFIVSVTLQVVDNFNLRCQSFMDIPANTLFAPQAGPTPPAGSLASYLEAAGRVEAIWFPFSDDPWLKVWTAAPTQPPGSRITYQPYNYPFADEVDPRLTTLIKQITTSAPSLTPMFTALFASITKAGIALYNSADLWGASMNTLLYVKDGTLPVTANGYAVQMKRADVQQAVHDFAEQFSTMLQAYQARGEYPVNAPLEIRVTGLDDPSHVHAPPGRSASTPLMSALTYDAVAIAHGYDCAVWFDVLTLPDTPTANTFYAELEAWIVERFVTPDARLFAEWSKGWAYTSEGGWTARPFMAGLRSAFTEGRPATQTWNAVVATYRKYDRANLFSNALLDDLFTPS